jgi:uncharacterized protein
MSIKDNDLPGITLDLIKEQKPDIIEKIESAIKWIFSNLWASEIDFIILYGSVAMGCARSDSDIDLVIGIKGNRWDLIRINKEIILQRPYEDLDIRLFEHLPIYIQKDAIKGLILYCKDLTGFYDLAYDTIKRYQDFKPYLDDYTGVVPLP